VKQRKDFISALSTPPDEPYLRSHLYRPDGSEEPLVRQALDELLKGKQAT
jgi:hypothetical protein